MSDRLAPLLATFIVTLMLSSCGGGAGETDLEADGASIDEGSAPSPSETSPDSNDFCTAAEEIQRLDDRSQAKSNEILAPFLGGENRSEKAFDRATGRLQTYLSKGLPPLLDSYDRLEEGAPPEIKDDIMTMKTFTRDFASAFDELDSLRELDDLEQILAGADFQKAVEAIFAVDKITRQRCNVTLAD
jgi:hypothetical protein